MVDIPGNQLCRVRKIFNKKKRKEFFTETCSEFLARTEFLASPPPIKSKNPLQNIFLFLSFTLGLTKNPVMHILASIVQPHIAISILHIIRYLVATKI